MQEVLMKLQQGIFALQQFKRGEIIHYYLETALVPVVQVLSERKAPHTPGLHALKWVMHNGDNKEEVERALQYLIDYTAGLKSRPKLRVA